MHSALEKAVVGSHCMSQQGMPWRENYGLICCLISTIVKRDPQPLLNLRKEVADAEEILSKRDIKAVEDLNVGDLATFMELTMPMELLKEFQWSDFPNLENLYRVCSKVPGFSEIHQPFLDFCQMYRTSQIWRTFTGSVARCRASRRSTSPSWTSARCIGLPKSGEPLQGL